MQQGRVGPWRRGRNPPRDCFDAGSSHDAGWHPAVFGSGGRVNRRKHFRFVRGLERGRHRLARGAETDGTARGFQRLRVRHREAKRHAERQAECEARAFANHGPIIHPPGAHEQLEVPARPARRPDHPLPLLGLAALRTSAAILPEAASRRLGVVHRAPPARSRGHAAPNRAARHFGVGDARRLPHTEIRTVRVFPKSPRGHCASNLSAPERAWTGANQHRRVPRKTVPERMRVLGFNNALKTNLGLVPTPNSGGRVAAATRGGCDERHLAEIQAVPRTRKPYGTHFRPVVAGGTHATGPKETWIAADPFNRANERVEIARFADFGL
jgi:hypothetical protein